MPGLVSWLVVGSTVVNVPPMSRLFVVSWLMTRTCELTCCGLGQVSPGLVETGSVGYPDRLAAPPTAEEEPFASILAILRRGSGVESMEAVKEPPTNRFPVFCSMEMVDTVPLKPTPSGEIVGAEVEMSNTARWFAVTPPAVVNPPPTYSFFPSGLTTKALTPSDEEVTVSL